MNPREGLKAQGIEFDRVRRLFDDDPLMRTMGARLSRIGAADVEAYLPVTPDILQHDGFVHAGALTAALDTACGAAVAARISPDRRILSIDLSVHLLRPAVGERIRITAHVVRAGSSVAIARGQASALLGDEWRPCTLMTATLALRD